MLAKVLISFFIVALGQPSFVPWLAPLAGALGYALFWHAMRVYPFWKQRFWRSALWYFFVSLTQLSWMSSIEYQGIYILFIWCGLSLWLGMQFGLLSFLIPYDRPLTFVRILAISSVWTLFEWSRFHVLCGYSWNLSGLALSNPYAIQLAMIFGILGLTFWVMVVNLLGLRAFLRKGIAVYLIWAGAASIPYLFGWMHITYHEREIASADQPSTLSCALVQTGLLPPEKVPIQGKIKAFVSPYDQWKRILYHLKNGERDSFDLIVLPEAVVPFSSGYLLYDQEKIEEIFFEVFGPSLRQIFPKIENTHEVSNIFWAQSLANFFHSEVIIGLDHVDPDGNSYNSAFHIKPFSLTINRYDKRVLMPLAEYLPFRWLAPLIKSYGISDFFTPGERANIFDGKIPMSASICYEETFPHKVREGRLLGARLLVNVTNDGWYPRSRLPSQHFEHAKFRAVENGTALIRACNTGVSAVVDSLGRTLSKLDEQNEKKDIQTGALFAELSTYEYPTFFMIWGNWGIVSLSFLFLGTFVLFKKELHL